MNAWLFVVICEPCDDPRSYCYPAIVDDGYMQVYRVRKPFSDLVNEKHGDSSNIIADSFVFIFTQ